MPAPKWGYVYARCPDCGRRNRILVTFPKWNGPFEPTTHECMCGAKLRTTDPHKYDADGHIIDGGHHLKCNVIAEGGES
jgi:hypothetical protein